MTYKLGARGEANAIDCYGVTLRVARAMGIEVGDAWRRIFQEWNETGRIDAATGLPAGWHLVADVEAARRKPVAGDVWLLEGDHQGVGIIGPDLRLWTALPLVGAVALDPHQAPPASEVWRQ